MLAACARPAVPRAVAERDTPPVVEALAPPVTLTIAHPATAYDEDMPRDPVVDAISGSETIERGLRHDPRLDAAAAELADVLRQGASLSPELVQFATHAHGIVEPPTFYTTPPPTDVLAPPNTRIGTAGELTLVIHVGPVRFQALPRASGGAFELRATLAPPYAHPRVTVTEDDRLVVHPAVIVDGTAFRASITCAGTTAWITVEADAPTPLAVVPVSCGMPAETFRVEPDRNVQTTDVEHRLTALINRERIAVGLQPLHTDRRATLVAAGYAHTMLRANDIAHDLAGTPVSRMADAGRRPLLVDETTLRADDLAQASMLLLDNPGYRAQVVAKNATHIGVGVARSPMGELFVAIDYIEIPPPLDAAALEARVAAQIIGKRNTRRTLRASTSRRGRPVFVPAPPLVDDELTANARYYARQVAMGWSSATVDVMLNRQLLGARHTYDGIHKEVIEVTDPESVDESKLFAAGSIVDAIGVGVAQSARDGWLSGRIYMVILYGRYPTYKDPDWSRQ